LAAVEGFVEGSSIFSEDDADRAYFVNGTQVANMDENALGLRLTRKVISAHRPRLKADPRVDLRKSGSDWIIVAIASDDDVELAVELAELAAAAHRPPPGVTAKPPPTGAELARRRRFH
jgi:hypothetical protein